MNDVTSDSYSIISTELQKVSGPRGQTDDSIQIVCPFHEDTDPSLGVYMGIGMQIPLGFFNCFGCGTKGPWNVLANKLGLKNISSVNDKIKTVHEIDNKLKNLHNKLKVINGTTHLNTLIKSLGNPAYYPWSRDQEWRGYPGGLVQECGGLFLIEPHLKVGELVCFFPVKVGKRYYGGVKAYLSKRTGGKSSYIATKGDWAQEYGAFPYDYTKNLIQKYNLEYAVLVEGPRDALRLLMEGIPAIAILGARQFTREKLRIILKMGIRHLFTMPDSDNGGKQFKETIKKTIVEYNERMPKPIKYNNFKLEPIKGKKGKASKVDPDSMPIRQLEDFMDIISEDLGYGLAPCFKE
jgi:5S rRNA maturation endonuclease (ribonuclease M5)